MSDAVSHDTSENTNGDRVDPSRRDYRDRSPKLARAKRSDLSTFESASNEIHSIKILTVYQRHEDTHRGQRQHTCAICQRTFGRKDALKRHARVHEGPNSLSEMGVEPQVSPTIQGFIDSNTCSVASMPELQTIFADGDGAGSTAQLKSGAGYHVEDMSIATQSSMPFSNSHAWPEATDLLDILMNVDAGWPMDIQIPLTDLTPENPCDSEQIYSRSDEASLARARQAMRHMSNLMQDLSFNLATEVEATGVSSDYLDNCLSAFFKRFVLIFPVVHQPTFSLKNCASPLLLNMIVLGSLFFSANDTLGKVSCTSSDGHSELTTSRVKHSGVLHMQPLPHQSVSYSFTIRVINADHRKWQSMVDQVNTVDLKTGVQLVMTALLGQTHAFLSRRRSTRMTSHAFHGLGFYWARQCDMLVTRPFSQVPSPEMPPEVIQQQWEAWAAQETRHRAVLGHYILDGLISQFSGLPTSDRHVTNIMVLPSSAKAYEALTANAWIAAMGESPQTSMTFCQIYLQLFDPSVRLEYKLSPFSIQVVLGGLLSLISDHRQAQGTFVGAKDLASISDAMWQMLDTQIESTVHSADQRLDLLLRWHAICIELCANTNLLIRHLCETFSVEQDLYNGKSRAEFDVKIWLSSREARRAILHASAITELVMELSLRRMQSIHVPFAVMVSSIVLLAVLSAGRASVSIPEVIDWQRVCLLNTGIDRTSRNLLDLFLESSEDAWDMVSGGQNLFYKLNMLQAVLSSLSGTWGIALDMHDLINRLEAAVKSVPRKD
ncbi:hypothetical protein E4T48_00574 [Aureobasidium sp. EXF-10727]|nr:hypothetical protein E4T48_00574 [Aureobasidium sp. EXF-10727]